MAELEIVELAHYISVADPFDDRSSLALSTSIRIVDPMSSTEPLAVDLSTLAADLASGGLGGHDADLHAVVRAARARGVSPVLVDILADPDQPDVARLPAFGRIASSLSFRPPALTIAPPTRRAA